MCRESVPHSGQVCAIQSTMNLVHLPTIISLPSSSWLEVAQALEPGFRNKNWAAGREGLCGYIVGAPPGGQMSLDSKEMLYLESLTQAAAHLL